MYTYIYVYTYMYIYICFSPLILFSLLSVSELRVLREKKSKADLDDRILETLQLCSVTMGVSDKSTNSAVKYER